MNFPLKFMIKRASLLIYTTFFLMFVSALVFGPQSAGAIFLVLAAVALQVLIALYKKVYSATVPLEEMKETLEDVCPNYLEKLKVLLVLTPLITGANLFLGIILVASCYLVASRAIWRISYRISAKKSILKNNQDSYVLHAPEVVAYVSGLEDVAYQINQWIPVLEKFDKRVAVIIRERRVFAGMDKTDIPVYFARTQFDVEFLLATAGSVRTVLYPANTMKNVQALRHFRLNHFFINHGESDKAVNQSKLLMAYDKLLVGGPLAEKRLREAGLPLRDGQVEYVGRPQAEMFLDKALVDKEIKTILYAPTWEGFVDDVNYSSVRSLGYDIIKKINEETRFSIIFKPHPYTGKRNSAQRKWLDQIRKYCESHDVEVVGEMESIHLAMNRSDFLITDISSVLNEYLITGKPVAICDVKGLGEKRLSQDFPSSKAAYICQEADGILKVLEDIKHVDRLKVQRAEVRRYSLSDFPEGALNRFISVVQRGGC